MSFVSEDPDPGGHLIMDPPGLPEQWLTGKPNLEWQQLLPGKLMKFLPSNLRQISATFCSFDMSEKSKFCQEDRVVRASYYSIVDL